MQQQLGRLSFAQVIVPGIGNFNATAEIDSLVEGMTFWQGGSEAVDVSKPNLTKPET